MFNLVFLQIVLKKSLPDLSLLRLGESRLLVAMTNPFTFNCKTYREVNACVCVRCNGWDQFTHSRVPLC